MSFPQPIPGLVIRYSYLWHSEHLQGQEEGLKDRPCAIVAAIIRDAASEPRVLVIPITHAPPSELQHAIEIPTATKKRLGLDALSSWIVISQSNEFIWPGPDLRHIADHTEGSIAYGILPPKLFVEVRERLLENHKHGNLNRVVRTE